MFGLLAGTGGWVRSKGSPDTYDHSLTELVRECDVWVCTLGAESNVCIKIPVCSGSLTTDLFVVCSLVT